MSYKEELKKLLHKAQTSALHPLWYIKVLFFIFCTCVSVFQLSGCIQKLIHPPISTHYKFNFNTTILYPALTICRQPPFKESVLKEYKFDITTGILDISGWKNFDFDNITVEEFVDKVTYRDSDILVLYALNGFKENVVVTSSYHLRNGRCFTLKPLKHATGTVAESGWDILLKHSDHSSSLPEITYDKFIGFDVFIHEPKEPWTENPEQSKSIVERILIDSGEDVEVKIQAMEYWSFPNQDEQCEIDINYSRTKCTLKCRDEAITKEVGCTAPWLSPTDKAQCRNFNTTRDLIKIYNREKNVDYQKLCQCHRSCDEVMYEPAIMNRRKGDPRYSQVSVFYQSKMVRTFHEKPGYDWNVFLADLGGSLGFFLGISVLGTIGLLEQLLWCLMKKREKLKSRSKQLPDGEQRLAEKKDPYGRY